jgi:hypothetical protein
MLLTHRYPRACPAAVAFFDPQNPPHAEYLTIATLSVWWPADMVAFVSTVERAERSKAAKLGANGIIRGGLVGDSIQPRYVADVSGTAIFIPADSSRVVAACTKGQGAGSRRGV